MTSDLPEHADEAKNDDTPKQEKPKKERKRKGWFTLFIAWLALIFTALGIAAGYKNWLRIHDKAKANKANIEVMQGQLQTVPSNEQLVSVRDELAQKTQAIEESTSDALAKTQKYAQQAKHYAETIDAQVAEVTQLQAKTQNLAKPTSSQDWVLSETGFLLRMANRQLYIEKDKTSAIASLKAADENLAHLGSPHYLPVRQQLTQDIMKLEQYAEPPTRLLSQKITVLMLQLQPLPAKNANVEAGERVLVGGESDKNAEFKDTSLWAEIKRNTQDTINDAIIIRKHGQPIENALDADSRNRLYELLKLRLETLRLLMLKGFNDEYHQQIKLINSTVLEYYPEVLAKPLQDSLTELDGYHLNPQKPDISSSMKQMESAMLTDAKSDSSATTE